MHFFRHFTHSCAWHGQGDPGPVPGGSSGQRHGGPAGRIIWNHYGYCPAHWCQWQPSPLYPKWVEILHCHACTPKLVFYTYSLYSQENHIQKADVHQKRWKSSITKKWWGHLHSNVSLEYNNACFFFKKDLETDYCKMSQRQTWQHICSLMYSFLPHLVS